MAMEEKLAKPLNWIQLPTFGVDSPPAKTAAQFFACRQSAHRLIWRCAARNCENMPPLWVNHSAFDKSCQENNSNHNNQHSTRWLCDKPEWRPYSHSGSCAPRQAYNAGGC